MKRGLRVSLIVLATAGAYPGSPQVPPSPAERALLEREGFVLQQNYPNPFNPETFIPFILSEDLFEERSSVRVSIVILTALQSFVATPVATHHPAGENVRVTQLEYTISGQHVAYWDGRDQSGREVASGIYLLQIIVDGRPPQYKKIFVKK